MKNKLSKMIGLLLIIVAIQSCSTLSGTQKSPEYEMDLVCGMKVERSEAYKYKYNNKKYCFDSYNCKQSFIMDPEKFINNKSVVPTGTMSTP